MDNHQENNSMESVSLWMEEALPSFSPIDKDINCDVCIVGGGIVGLTCAYFILQRGLSVTVIDKGQVGGGQSARTTGHLAWALDDHFYHLKTIFGLEGARMAAESHLAAIQAIEKIIEEEKIDCDLEKLDAYLFLAPEDSQDILQKEWETLQEMGLPVHKLDHLPIQSFHTGPCIQFRNHAQFHIFKYLKGLIRVLLRKGARIYGQTEALSIVDGTPCITQANRFKITSKSAIVATNTPINDRLIIHSKQAAYRTYVIAGLVPKGSVAHGLYYDTLDPYHYIRLQPWEKDQAKEWLIIGGEDHKTGQEKNISEIYTRLENWTRHRFPMLESIAYRWSGQIYEPVDCLAYIGLNPHDKHIYIVTGDSGNGLTHGTIAGLLLPDLMLKGHHPWAALYDPSRKKIESANEYIKENLNVACQYCDWLSSGDVDSIQEITPGEGAVIRSGIKKYAVYKDKKGEIHCLSAVCPHLGCIVHWNPGEKSWDCPCHGSRFSVNGAILNGPATQGLRG